MKVTLLMEIIQEMVSNKKVLGIYKLLSKYEIGTL